MAIQELTQRNPEDEDEHRDDVAPDAEAPVVERDGAAELERLVPTPTQDRGYVEEIPGYYNMNHWPSVCLGRS